MHEVVDCFPFLRNSGFIATPKSFPAIFPEVSSRQEEQTLCVSGTTVLFTTTTWYLSFLLGCPILAAAARIIERSILPSSAEGVPTQINEMSVS